MREQYVKPTVTGDASKDGVFPMQASYIKARMNDDVMIVCADSLIIYYLNATAAFLLNNVDGVSTVDEIKQKFLAKYAVEERELENDLIEVVRDLQWKKILILE